MPACVQGHNKVTIPTQFSQSIACFNLCLLFLSMSAPLSTHSTAFWLLVPTYNPGAQNWNEWIGALKVQTSQPLEVVVVDSGSTDGTIELSRQAGFKVLEVKVANFNHGGTRQWALDQAMASMAATGQAAPPWVVYLTQDAIFASPSALTDLLEAFQDPQVGAVFGRQLPKNKAPWMEAHARHFNYPEQSRTVQLQDKETLGIKACFFSDAFAAYRIQALLQQGGFPAKVPLGEDTFTAAKLLLSGHSLRYQAHASVYHSHQYNSLQDFQRMFDTGVFHAQNHWLRQTFGKAEGEGWRYAQSQLAYLKAQAQTSSLVLGLFQIIYKNAVKLAGYRLGLMHEYLPLRLKQMCAMHKPYWATPTEKPSA